MPYISSIGNGAVQATKLITNGFSAGGTSMSGLAASVSINDANCAKETLSGALTANTLATVLTLTGAGHVPYLAAYAKDATSRTVRMQVIVDGVTVFDATSNAITGSGTGILAAGQLGQEATGIQSTPIRFNSTCVVKVASSLTETDKVAIAHVLI